MPEHAQTDRAVADLDRQRTARPARRSLRQDAARLERITQAGLQAELRRLRGSS